MDSQERQQLVQDLNEIALNLERMIGAMDPKLRLFTVDEVALILRKSPSSLKSDMTRNPECVPPMVKIPGSKKHLCRAYDLANWIEDQIE
jgi:hypothetical protein